MKDALSLIIVITVRIMRHWPTGTESRDVYAEDITGRIEMQIFEKKT